MKNRSYATNANDIFLNLYFNENPMQCNVKVTSDLAIKSGKPL